MAFLTSCRHFCCSCRRISRSFYMESHRVAVPRSFAGIVAAHCVQLWILRVVTGGECDVSWEGWVRADYICALVRGIM